MDSHVEKADQNDEDVDQTTENFSSDLTTASKMSLSTGEVDVTDQSTEDVPLEEVAHNLSHNALFKALSELTEEEDSGTDSGLRPPRFSTLSQHPIDESILTTGENRSSNVQEALPELSQHQLNETDLQHQTSLKTNFDTPASQYRFQNDSSLAINDRRVHSNEDACGFDNIQEESSKSPEYGMCSTRPGTVIDKAEYQNKYSSHIVTSGVLETPLSAFDKTDSRSQRISISDTLVHTGKSPISASTPFKRKASGSNDSDKEVADSGRPSSPLSSEPTIDIRALNTLHSEDPYISVEERISLTKDLLSQTSSQSSGVVVDRKGSLDTFSTSEQISGSRSAEDISSNLTGSLGGNTASSKRSSIASIHSVNTIKADMLGGSQVGSRTSLDRLSVNGVEEVAGDVLSPESKTRASNNGGTLAKPSSLDSSTHSGNSRASIGSVERYKTGSPVDDVHVADPVPSISSRTFSDRMSTGSLPSNTGKISIGRLSGASSLASEGLDRKPVASIGSASSAQLLLDEMYMASRKTNSNFGSISTGSLSDLSSRHSSKAPSERLSNASSLAALSEHHAEQAPDSARSHGSSSSGLPTAAEAREISRDPSEDGDSQSLSDRVAALLSEAVPREPESEDERSNRRVSVGVSETGSTFSNRRDSTESEQDMAKITTQYSAILKSDLASTGLMGSVESLGSDDCPRTERREAAPSDGVEIISIVKDDGKVEHVPGTVDLNSSIESEDALDRDVRRILAKYGRSLSDSEDEPDKKNGASPAMSLDSIGERINTLLKSQDNTDVISEGQNTLTIAGTQTLPNYLFDDPGKSMSLPFDSTSNVSDETPHHTQAQVVRAQRQHTEVTDVLVVDDVMDDLASERSVPKSDDLEHRVQQLLGGTNHLGDGKAMSIQTESDRQSVASSLDFKALARDLDDIQSNLESLKSDSDVEQNSRRSSDISQPSISQPTNSALTSEYSTPKKYNWDHGADVGIVSREDEDQPKWSEMPLEKPKQDRQYMGPNPLLTSGVVPFDVALDIMHGSGASPQHKPQLSSALQPDIRPAQLSQEDDGDREVAAFNSSDRHNTSQQISDIMEKDTPHPDYKYLQDSEDNESINIGIGPRTSKFDTEQFSPFNVTGSYSLQMSPLKTHQPFNTFGRLGNMFSSQVNKVSHSDFDQSIELRSPVKRQMETNFRHAGSRHSARLSPSSYETEDLDRIKTLMTEKSSPKILAKSHEDLRYRYKDSSPSQQNTSGRSYEQDLHGREEYDRTRSFNQSKNKSFEERARLSRSYENLSTSAHRELLHSAKRADIYSMGNAVLERMRSPTTRPPTYDTRSGSMPITGQSLSPLRLSPDATKEGLQQDADWLQNLGNRSERTAGRVAATQSPRSRSPASLAAREAVPEPDYYPQHSAVETGYVADLEARNRDLKERRDEYPVPDRYSRVDAQNSSRRETNRPILTPYKPPGSNTLYYVEMNEKDDCAQSVAMSETTVESTHPGSDDARPPSFPSQVLGSRSEPSSDSPPMYQKSKPSAQRAGELVTIHEQSSHFSSDEKEEKTTNKTKKVEKELSFTRTRNWINGNFSDNSNEEKSSSGQRGSDPYSRSSGHGSRDDYLREDPAIADALRKYQPKPTQRDSGDSHWKTEVTTSVDPYKGRESLPSSGSQKDSASPRRSTTETLNDVLSPTRNYKPGPINSPIHFSTPQKYGTARLSEESEESQQQYRRSTEATPKETTMSSIGRYDEGKQRTVDEICAEYTARYKKYDYFDILTDMKSPETVGKGRDYGREEVSKPRDRYEPIDDYTTSNVGYTDRMGREYEDGKTDDLQPQYTLSKGQTDPLSFDRPVGYSTEARDVYRELEAVLVTEEREEGYHPYIPDIKYHSTTRSPPSRNSLLRDREKAELENSLLRDRQLANPEQRARARNREYIDERLSPHRAIPEEHRRTPSPPASHRRQVDGVDYRNSYSPDKYGTYKSYNDLVEREYDTLTKEYESRAIETRDIERAQAEGVIRPSRDYVSSLMSGADDVRDRPRSREVDFVDRHEVDYTSFKYDRLENGRSQYSGHEERQFSPLYPDQDEEGTKKKPEQEYSLYDGQDDTRTPDSWSRGHRNIPREGSPGYVHPLPAYSKPPLPPNRLYPTRRRSPQHSLSPTSRSSRSERPVDHSIPSSAGYGARSYSPARSRSPTARSAATGGGLDDTDTLLNELPSFSEVRAPTYKAAAEGQNREERMSRKQKQMLELMARQSPGISYVPRAAQDMWDRLQHRKNESRSGGNTTAGSSLDMSRLSSLLKNPAQHFVHSGEITRSDVDSTLSEEEEKSKMRQISEKLKRFAEPKRSTRSGKGRSHTTGDDDDKKATNDKSGESKQRSTGSNDNRPSGAGQARNQASTTGGGDGSDNGDDKREKRTPSKSTTFADPKDEMEMDDSTLDTTTKDDSTQTKDESRGAKPKKMAWVITDETLQSVPEDSTLDSVSSDFTTCSSVESDGKLVTRTSKRHLPADPKLLKLQQKIAKQKVRYEREHYRELKRKEKIHKLEEMLREKGRTLRRQARKGESHAQRTGRVTSTPASARYVSSTSGSSSLTVSDITTSTLTGSTFNSEGSTTLRESSPERSTQMSSTISCSSEQSTASNCVCTHDGPKKVRQQSPKKQMTPKQASPSRKKRVQDSSRPRGMKLQEVDWTREESRDQSYGGYYMEVDPPKSSKRSRKHSQSPSRRRDKENEILRRKAKEESSRVGKKPSKHRHKSPSGSRTKDFGATCPTPISVTPPRRQEAGDVVMVSEAVQTGADDSSMQANVPSFFKTRGAHPGMFTPEMENTPRVNYKGEKLTVKAGPSGMTWFVPMAETKPWRRPLKERQAYNEALEAELDKGEKMDPMAYGMDGLHAATGGGMDPEIYLGKSAAAPKIDQPTFEPPKLSLQEAFLRRKQNFISRSRQRERHVLLRAQERRIQEVHQTEREQLFMGKRDKSLDYHPICEQHFQPKKRTISRREMLAITKKKYADLPEVKQQKKEKMKAEEHKTNRIRAKIYKQRILHKVLNKDGPWLEV